MVDDFENNTEVSETGNDEKLEEIGVRINLISSRKLDTMSSREKLRFILDEVKRGTVLVLERGLTAVEEIDLIKSTMSEIDHQTFIGIEMQSYSSEDVRAGSWFSKLLGRTRVPRMSVIGPANLLKTIQKDGNMIQAMILTGKSILKEPTNDTDKTEDIEDTEDAQNADELDDPADGNEHEGFEEDVSEDERTDSESGSEAPRAIPVTDAENDEYEPENDSEFESERSDPYELENDKDKEMDKDKYNNRAKAIGQQTLDQSIYSSLPPLATRVEIEYSKEKLDSDSTYNKTLPKLSELPTEIRFKNNENLLQYMGNNNGNSNSEGTSFLYRRLKNYREE